LNTKDRNVNLKLYPPNLSCNDYGVDGFKHLDMVQ